MHKTRKHLEICASDSLRKPVDSLPGIGVAYNTTLKANRFNTAQEVYNLLKSLEFNKERFQQWAKTLCGMSKDDSSLCFECLKEWHQQFGAQVSVAHKTRKHVEICASPILLKPVNALPGIGPAYGVKLAANGYPMAKDVYDKLKSLGFNKVQFQQWLKTFCVLPEKDSSLCFECLKEWNSQFGH